MDIRRTFMEDSQEKQYDYNSEPVEYCTKCLSLAIRDVNGHPYCDKCGCTQTDKTDIYTWEKKYGEVYGGSYLNK